MHRIAFISDTHADQAKKWDEHARVMSWIADDLASRDVSLVCHGGDVFDGPSTPEERTFVAAWIRDVTHTAPLAIVAGNHDKPLDIEFLSRLRTNHPITAVETAVVRHLETAQGPVSVGFLPWPRLSSLLATLGETDHDHADEVAVRALRDIIRGLAMHLSVASGPKILLAHAMIEGARTDSRQPLVGCDLTVSPADLAMSRADIVVAGHIHAEQELDFAGTPIVIPGCPYHRTFGEPGPTSYVIATWPDSKMERATWPGPRIERVQVPATPMLLLENEWLGNGWAADYDPARCVGAEVRFRYRVQSDQRAAAKSHAADFKREAEAKGAKVVVPREVVIAEARARSPEVANATTLGDKLRALWESQGITVDEARANRLVRMAEGLSQ